MPTHHHPHQSFNQFPNFDHNRQKIDEALEQDESMLWFEEIVLNNPEWLDSMKKEGVSISDIFRRTHTSSEKQISLSMQVAIAVLIGALSVEGCIPSNLTCPVSGAEDAKVGDIAENDGTNNQSHEAIDIDKASRNLLDESIDKYANPEHLDDKRKALFEALYKERGEKAAVYAQKIYENYINALEAGQSYNSYVKVKRGDGTEKEILNKCVGFVMSAFSGLPFKVIEGDNKGRYLNDYDWGKSEQSQYGKDAIRNFIPDIVGDEKHRYKVINKIDPESINWKVGKHLATGEYAIGAVYNHVFLIYKDLSGDIKMVHSGAVVDEKGGIIEASKVNEVKLEHYVKYNNRHAYFGQHLAFLPLSEIVDLADEQENQAVVEYSTRMLVEQKKKGVEKVEPRIPVITNLPQIAVNTHSIAKKDPKKEESKNNKLADQIDDLKITFNHLRSSVELFKDGVGDYNSFKERVVEALQSNEKDPEKQIKNATAILARSAIGIYQIVPRWHFNKMNWTISGEEGLKNIYEFIRSKNLQSELLIKIISEISEKYGPDPIVIAAVYYKGPAIAEEAKRFRDEMVNGGDVSDMLKDEQAYGYGSVFKYVTELMDVFDVRTIENKNDLRNYMLAIAYKETGYLTGISLKNKKRAIRKSEKMEKKKDKMQIEKKDFVRKEFGMEISKDIKKLFINDELVEDYSPSCGYYVFKKQVLKSGSLNVNITGELENGERVTIYTLNLIGTGGMGGRTHKLYSNYTVGDQIVIVEPKNGKELKESGYREGEMRKELRRKFDEILVDGKKVEDFAPECNFFKVKVKVPKDQSVNVLGVRNGIKTNIMSYIFR